LDVFSPDVFKPLSTYRDAVDWLVDAGIWRRHRLSGGPFFWRRQFTDLAPTVAAQSASATNTAAAALAIDTTDLRTQTLACLASASTVRATPGRDTVHAPSPEAEALTNTVNHVLASARQAMLSNVPTIRSTGAH
jgi:hypothetical protein